MSESEMIDFEQRQKEIPAKVPEVEVPQDNVWSDDVLGRRELAEKLISFIDRQTQPLVISVDGAWGSGKTFFLKRLEADLKNREFETIYFNAWEDDFYDDPLVALLGTICENFNKTPFKPNVKQIKKYGIKFLRLAVSEILKNKAGFDPSRVLKEIEDEIFEQYAEHQTTRKTLKDSLKGLAEKSRKKSNQPLVFIIDELDRCRPTFTIELLERVKHIFDIENVVFILGMDKTQLEKSIRSVYGEIDSDIYLRRFFDFEFSLPEPDLEQFFHALIKRYKLELILRALMQLSSNKENLDIDNHIVNRHSPKFLSYFDLSLRDVDSIMRSLVVISKTCEENNSFFTNLVVPLLLIRLKNKELYEKIMKGRELPIMGYDYMRSQMKELDPKEISGILQNMEAYFYLLNWSLDEIIDQRRHIRTNPNSVNLKLFSKRIQEAKDPVKEITDIFATARDLSNTTTGAPELKYVQKLINLA